MSSYPFTPLSLTLLVTAALCAVYALVAWRMRGPEDPLLATVLRPLCVAYMRLYHGLSVFPREDVVPPTGPAIIVANHRSGVDPILLAIITHRRVRFLMAREYYETPGVKWAFRSIGCIPVNRDGNDLGATKAALKALRGGEVVGIFPQGGIREADGSFEGKAGAALLALRTGSPVVPFYIFGSRNLDSVLLSLLIPSRTRVHCGVPLRFPGASQKPSRAELENVATEILDSIARLKPLLTQPEQGPGSAES